MEDFNDPFGRALREALRREAETFPVDAKAVWQRVRAKLQEERK